MKRNKACRPQKRTTFLKLFLKAGCTAALCTAVFAGAFNMILDNKVENDITKCMDDSARKITIYTSKCDTEGRTFNELSVYMSMYTNYQVVFENLPDFMYHEPENYQTTSDFGNINNFAMSALLDNNGNIVASSRAKAIAMFLFGEGDKGNGYYICDPQKLDTPEVKQFYEEYTDLLGEDVPELYRFVSMDITSAYVDKASHSFVPHEADMKLNTYENGEHTIDTRHISITIDDDNYELVNFNKYESDEYPKRLMADIGGTLWKRFDDNKMQVSEYHKEASQSSGVSGHMWDFSCEMETPVFFGGEKYTLNLYYNFSAKGTIVQTIYIAGIAVFGAISIFLALLWAWQKNVRNKAQYAFEDHQRDLTDNLAHDIKTPLMAISGYAENVLNGKLTEEEKKEYLTAIIDNVSFTDSLISRTLYLNHTCEKSRSKEVIQVNDMSEEILSKYTLLLHEKKIVYSISGNAEIRAEKALMETIIENLISNVVKYTPDDGSLKIIIDKRKMTVINTVVEKIDTSELKRPFVRGDLARSNTSGNGLGLAIAERAALANGFSLTLSCTDKEFKAALFFCRR